MPRRLHCSLNPFAEGLDQMAMVDDDKLIAATLPHWCFGADHTGDIRHQANIRAIWEAARQRCAAAGCPAGAAMVTADGAFDTSVNPNAQEMLTASLHYCEVRGAARRCAAGACIPHTCRRCRSGGTV